MSKNWQRCQLGDVLNLINGRAYKKEEMLTEGVPILRIQNLNGGNNWFYSNLDLAEDKYCYKDDLLYAWSATFGPYWSKWDHKLIYHYHIWKIETSSVLYKQFAYYALWNITEALKASAHGVAMPHITKAGMEAWEIDLPPLTEQKIIAEKLDTLLAQVDSTKARLEQIPQILKRFRQATLTVAIQGDLTKNWRIENNIINAWTNQKASDLCIKVQSGSTPTGNPFEQNGKIPFLKVYNIVNQKIDFDYKAQFITDEVHRSKSKRSIAFPDDILMNIVGPPLGKIAILTDQYPEWNLNQAITLFRVDKEKLLSKFLYYVLCEGKLVRDVMHETKGIVGQINISLTQCREAIIPCPSLLEQHEIVRRVEQLFAYADTVEKQVNNALTRVNNLTQSILAKAFRGELTAQWRAENPDLISGENSAAALLEKIKAERAASGGKKTSRKRA